MAITEYSLSYSAKEIDKRLGGSWGTYQQRQEIVQ